MKLKSGSHSGKQVRSKRASGPTSPQPSETPLGLYDYLGLESVE
jgi:hypothetical protein